MEPWATLDRCGCRNKRGQVGKRRPHLPLCDPCSTIISAFIKANMPLLVSRVTAHLERQSRRIDLDPIYSDGMLAFLRAVRSFSPSRGVKFSTYAVRAIDRAIRSAHRSSKAQKLQNAGSGWLADAEAKPTGGVPEEHPRLSRLSEQELVVLSMRADRLTHREIAAMVGVSKQRSHQIKVQAIEKLLLQP